MRLTRRQLEKIILENYGGSSDVSDALGQIVSSQLEDDPEALGDMMEKDPGIMKSVGEYFKDNPDSIPGEVLTIAGEAMADGDEEQSATKDTNMFETYLHERSRDEVIADIALQLIEEEPGLGGRDIARTAIEVFNLEHRFGPNQPGAEEEEVFRALDVLVDEDQVFFDTQEDAWYIMGSPEAMSAMSPLYEEVVSKRDIKDVVMDILSDEGGAAGLDPIEGALEDLEDDDDTLPDSPIEDIISNVPGVKRHVDGDYVDTTKLEGRRMKISKSQLRRIINESALDDPFEWENKEYTVTERKPSRHKGVQNGKPMDLVIWEFRNPDKGGPGRGAMDIPKGVSLEQFFKSGEKEGFPDYYRKPETGADMNRAIKSAEDRGDWDYRSQNESQKKGKTMKISKRQLKRIIKEEKAKLLKEAFDPNDINANMGTSFFLGDAAGNLEVDGDLLDPAALRRLADALEQLYSGRIQTQGMVGFDID